MKLHNEGSYKNRFLCGLFTAIITLIITLSYMHLWGTNIHVPLTGYRSDSVGVLLEANNYVRGGDVHCNVCFGAPNINNYSYNFGDSSVPMPLIKLLTGLFGSVEVAVNIFAILNSVFLACSMYWVCCKLEVSEVIAGIAGISYSCISYFVLFCNTLLLIYAFCFYIPLFCFIVIEIMSPKIQQNDEKSRIKKVIFVIAVMLFTGLNSAYYAFLAMIVLAFAGLYALISLKSVDNVLLVVASYIAMGIGIAIYTLPNILHSVNSELFDPLWNSGCYYFAWILIGLVLVALGLLFYKKIYPYITIKTIWAILGGMIVLAGAAYVVLKKYTNYIGVYEGRSLYSVELGALNIVNIVLPAINNVFDEINTQLPLLIDLENQDVTALGILVGIGFCYSVLYVFQFERKENRKDEIVRICGLCNCFMVILAVKGGLSSLIATYVTTGIRNYNRICIFIAVFSLISFGLFIEKLFEKIQTIRSNEFRRIVSVCCCFAVVFAMVLSCPTNFILGDSFGLVTYEQRKKEYDEWQDIMNRIESAVPQDSMIVELPFVMEDKYFGELMDQGRAYEQVIPAIISKTTAWSYASGWNTEISMVDETEQFIQAVCDAGFSGIYMDTLLYHDDSYEEQLKALESVLGKPIVCNENRRYFFSLTGYIEN